MKAKKLLLNALPLFVLGGAMAAYAAAPTGGYLPNATLDPDCAPGDTDCFVQLAPDLGSAWDNTDGSVADETGSINYTEGNVGIGTTTPSGILDLVGDGTSGPMVFLRNNVGGNSVMTFGQSPSSDWASIGQVDGELSLSGGYDTVTNPHMTISNPGNVGIGTTDPIVKLEVVGSSKITDSLAVGGANIPSTYQLRVDAVKAGVSGTYDYQRGIFASVRPNPTLWTQPNNHSVGLTSSVLTDDKITATDTVSDLIGITSQYGAYTGTVGVISNAYGLKVNPYEIDGTITNAYDIFLSNTNGAGATVTNGYGIYQQNTKDNYFAGRVGIGTTTPKDKLHVKGPSSDIFIESNNPFLKLIDQNAGSGSLTANAGMIIMDSGENIIANIGSSRTEGNTGGGISLSTGDPTVVGDGEGGSLRFLPDNVEAMRIIQNGKVGIGTSTPISRLQIGETSTADTNNAIVLGKTEATAESNPPRIYSGNALGSGNASGNDLILQATSSSAGVSLVTDGVSQMYVTSDNPGQGGFVGIGTTTPDDKLEVSDGSIRVTNGQIIVGNKPSGTTCTNPINLGAIRFNPTTSKHQGCDGTSWKDLY